MKTTNIKTFHHHYYNLNANDKRDIVLAKEIKNKYPDNGDDINCIIVHAEKYNYTKNDVVDIGKNHNNNNNRFIFSIHAKVHTFFIRIIFDKSNDNCLNRNEINNLNLEKNCYHFAK